MFGIGYSSVYDSESNFFQPFDSDSTEKDEFDESRFSDDNLLANQDQFYQAMSKIQDSRASQTQSIIGNQTNENRSKLEDKFQNADNPY